MSVPETLGTDEIITTIFVVGFPEDFREREFQNLFAFAKGFEGCSLKLPALPDCQEISTSPGTLTRSSASASVRNQLIGFARFRTAVDALEACRTLQGRIVDIERGSTLKAEMAKKNLYLTPTRSRSALPFIISEQGKDSLFGPVLARRASLAGTSLQAGIRTSACEECSISNVRSLNISIPGQSAPISICAPSLAMRTECPHGVSETTKLSPNLLGTAPRPGSASGNGPNQTGPSLVCSGGLAFFAENPPCNTLYVGNLPPNASEAELRSIFSVAFGFRRMSFKPKLGTSPMCFVEFEDIRAATMAMESLYGTMLSNSSKGGIRLSYSKNPLGVRSTPPTSSALINGLFSEILPVTGTVDFIKESASVFAVEAANDL